MQYLEHFGLREEPFSRYVQGGFHVDCEAQKQAVMRLQRGVLQHKSLLLLTGDIGSGKSHVVQSLLESLVDPTIRASVWVMLGAFREQSLFERLAQRIGCPFNAAKFVESIQGVVEHLIGMQKRGEHALVVIDDAHHLANESDLDALRGMASWEHESKALLTFVLVGQSKLSEAVDANHSLASRVDVRVHLGSGDVNWTTQYINERMQAAGATSFPFHPEAIACIDRYTGGRPQLINTLADNSLFETFRIGSNEVLLEQVERAASDLHLAGSREQLLDGRYDLPSDIIEFGQDEPIESMVFDPALVVAEAVNQPAPEPGALQWELDN